MSDAASSADNVELRKSLQRTVRGFAGGGAALVIPFWCYTAFMNWSRTGGVHTRSLDTVAFVGSILLGLPFVALLPLERYMRIVLGVVYTFLMFIALTFHAF